MARKSNKNSKKDKQINSILILIVILLLILIAYLLFSKNNSDTLKPSGNIDIFEINCNYNCDCDTEDVFSENDFQENFDVLENKISWKYNNKLNIFTNSMYVMDNKIAPESTNIYQFVIKNNTIYDIVYDMQFKEFNDYQINMKYRLIKNDKYVSGSEEEWVYYEDLNLNNITLKNQTKDTYYLEWKWFSSDNDTKIGESENANYSLDIDIKAVGL